MLLSLDDVFMIIMTAFQVSLLSTILVVFYKKLGKILQWNNASNKVLADRINEIQIMVTDLSALFLKNGMKPEKTNSNGNAMSMGTPIGNHLLETPHMEHPDNENNTVSNGNTDKLRFNLKPHPAPISRPLSPNQHSSPQPHSPSPAVRAEINKINKSEELKNDLEYFKNHNDDVYKSEKPEFDNGSANELKSLEKEILFALQRLEKTKSNLDEEQEPQNQK
jgi:hypothetical protein